MPALSKVVGLVASWSELTRIGSAACVAIGAAVAQLAAGKSLVRLPSAGTHCTSVPRDTDHPLHERQRSRTDVDLRGALEAFLPNQQIIVLANREPCVHELAPNGRIVARHDASGLVTALEPVVRACSGVWVAHGSGSADRLTADRTGHLSVGTDNLTYTLRRVWLTPEEERGYYYGFANEGLWPLCHMAFAAPVFRRRDWLAYQRVNRLFADAVAAEIDSAHPIVFVHDYHFALVPRLLRERCPSATTLTFWHVPWPHPDQFSICPYAPQILEGLLGTNVLGFQTAQHCRNFFESVDRTLDAAVDPEHGRVKHQSHTVKVGPFPISVEWPSRWVAQVPATDECRRHVRAEFHIDPRAPLVVSVDRLDYTKGFEERLAAIERLLKLPAPDLRPVFLQVAAPSRVSLERYRELAARVRARVEHINQRFGDVGYTPVTYVERFTEPVDVFRYYRAADVCHVGSLDDGMNLVAKEFVAARDDEQGVLVLSRFAGAARELTGAVVVNPYDIDDVVEALVTALTMPSAEQRTRMRGMRAWVAEHNVYAWASDLLACAALARNEARFAGSEPSIVASRAVVPVG